MTEQILANLFLEARERLYKTILEAEGVGTKVYANSVLEQLNRELRRMRAAGNRFVDTRVPSQYQRGLDAIYAYFQSNHLRMRRPENFASIHTDAVNEIARNMQHMIDSSLVTVGRQVQRYVMKAQDEVLRQVGLRQTGVKIASGGTVSDMRAALVKELQENGFMTVQYGSGVGARQVPVDVYASMVARSTSREAGNTARLNQLAENGYDLVKITEHYPTCEVCAMHQGRVYSISGKDKRFPPLSRAFSKYNNIHPNCRHSATPWVESMHTPEEISEAIQQSNRPWKDSRSTREVALYNSQQDKTRQARNTMYQYERYKAVLGDDAPKSLWEFARTQRQDGDMWRFMQLDYRRQRALQLHPERALPNAGTATAADRKFTGYLFNAGNHDGWPKGVAFTSRLGYNVDNWQELQSQIIKRASLYPSTHKGADEWGEKYEQLLVLYGSKGKPANVLVSWKVNEGKTWITSAYIKEVK